MPAAVSEVEKAEIPEALQRERRASLLANTTATANTKLAACLAALGFAPTCRPVEHVQKGGVVTEFVFTGPSTRKEFAHLRHTIASLHEARQLEPMHPLCVMMLAQRNYDALMKMQDGEAWRLVALKNAGLQVTRYFPGPELPGMVQRGAVHWIDDVCLAAAVSVVGIPVIDFRGSSGSREYGLPVAGYVLQREDGTPIEHATADLIARAPTAQDPLRLALEEVNPLHPVALAYDALCSRAELKKRLQNVRPLLLHEDGGLRALVSANHSGRVMDVLSKRFGAPPIG